MPRRRAFEVPEAIRAARDQFWLHGFEATSLADLERVTKLNRSSLYHAFGTKRQLFDLAFDSYLTEVAWPRLAPVEAPGAGITEVTAYFGNLASALIATGSRRGCLAVNTITELGPHDQAARDAGYAYRQRITHAFKVALARTMPAEVAARRADLLTGILIGVLVTTRLDPASAAALAQSTAEELSAWSSPAAEQ